jgi:hypothetical protein
MMTDEQIKVSIAEACGWVHEYDTRNLCAIWISPKSGFAYRGEDGMIPNYCADLNAMAQAEATLFGWTEIDTYLQLLGPAPRDRAFAKARQRAEAFLKTKNLWRE